MKTDVLENLNIIIVKCGQRGFNMYPIYNKQCKDIKKNNNKGRTSDLIHKIQEIRGKFKAQFDMQKI